MRFLEVIWSMITNDGMYSNTEAAIILPVSFVIAILIMCYISKDAEKKLKRSMIHDLGYEGYLRVKQNVQKLNKRR